MMKNLKLMTIAIVVSGTLMMGCKKEKTDQQKVDEMVAKVKSTENAKSEKPATVPKEINIGSYKLEYDSPYIFTIDSDRSQKLAGMSPDLLAAEYHKLNIPPNEGTAGFMYQKMTRKGNLEGLIDGLVNGYKGMGNVTIMSNNQEDFTEKVGLPAIMGNGKMAMKTSNGSNIYGEFTYLGIQKGNELLLLQAIFEQPGNSQSKYFMKMINSVKSRD